MNPVIMKSSPNLIFVFADQMRGCYMGCAGNTSTYAQSSTKTDWQGWNVE